jgi:hypothetical protein
MYLRMVHCSHHLKEPLAPMVYTTKGNCVILLSSVQATIRKIKLDHGKATGLHPRSILIEEVYLISSKIIRLMEARSRVLHMAEAVYEIEKKHPNDSNVFRNRFRRKLRHLDDIKFIEPCNLLAREVAVDSCTSSIACSAVEVVENIAEGGTQSKVQYKSEKTACCVLYKSMVLL